MKLYKIITKALLALTAIVSFASCSSDDYDRVGMPNGAQVYFSNEAKAEYLLAENQNSVEVEVKRVNTNGALTAEVESEDASGLFTVASTVSFADGEATAKLPINFDFSKLESDKDYPVTLNLKSDTCAYGDNSITVKIKYAPWSEWKKMGEKDENSTYTYTQMLGGTYDQITYYRESMLDKTKAQLKLEDWFYGVDLIVDWNKTNNTLKVSPQFSGYVHNTYGNVFVADTYTYVTEVLGREADYEKYKSYYDETLGQFKLNIVYYVSEGSFGNGYETLQLPGYEQSNYTISIEDGGSYMSGKKLGQVFNMTMGTDLSSLKYAIFPGQLTADEITAKANGIFSGEIESTATSENGYKLTLVDAEGDYTLVAIGYDVNSKWQATQSVSFTVKAPSAGKTWETQYLGNYSYTVVLGNEDGTPSVDEGLTLSICNEDETLYKISPWGNESELFFTFDADGKVVVLDGETGVESEYGMVMIGEAANVDAENFGDIASSYDPNTGTFKFAVAYYCEAGIFGAGYETFQLTSAAKARMIAKARAKAMTKAKTVKASAKVTKVRSKGLGKFTTNARTLRVLQTKTIK